MKMSEYAAQQKAAGRKLDVKSTVSAHTLVDEIIEMKDFVRIEKTSYGSPAYMVQISDDTGFFTTASLTRQMDKWLAAGVDRESIKGSRFLITSTTLPAGDGKPERSFLQFDFIDGPAAEDE